MPSRQPLREAGGVGDRAAVWFERVLAARAWCRGLAAELLTFARGGGGAGFEERHLYALLLEHLAHKIPPGDLEALAGLLDGLGLTAGGRLQPLAREEGFGAGDLAGFAAGFTRYLERNAAFHRQLAAQPGSALARRRFLDLSRQSCRVLLARYLFSPEEVVDLFASRVRTSQGLPSMFVHQDPQAVVEAERALSRLPSYEARIVRLILDREQIFWVAQSPDCSLNALVEYPLTTVSLVLKPPGSSHEIQFKRAGYPDANTLRIAYGDDVPGHHRLDGGGYGLGLQWEAMSAARVARAFRAAHGEEPSLSVPVSVQLVHTVPAGERDVYTMTYFTDPRVFGPDYEAMRRALRAVVAAYKREGGWDLPHATEEVGRTNEFLIQTKPAQAVFVGSSSFRVDKVADYLTAAGVRRYLRAVPGLPRGPAGARLLVDTVLGEVLERYEPPAPWPGSIEAYVAAALASPANRREADRAYRSLVTQLAGFWGTLLAWGASSRGESVVARNVGLRAVWGEGRWSIRAVFMDHDQLNFYAGDPERFHPLLTLESVRIDEEHLVSGVSGPPTPRNRSVLTLLELIYRVTPYRRRRGRALFRQQLAAAYRRTRRQQTSGEPLVGFPWRRFVDSLAAWDETVALCLRARERGVKDWRRSVKRSLKRRGREVAGLENFLEAFEHHERFLRKYRFLYLQDGAPR